MSLTLTALWAHAAWREAARVRATEADLDLMVDAIAGALQE